jgi:hypothetical protein
LAAIDARAQAEHELATAEARIEQLERELSQAIVRCGEWATKAGEAQGRLEASEMAGTVQGWKERATTAEAERGKLREAICQVLAESVKLEPQLRQCLREAMLPSGMVEAGVAALKEPTDA